MSRTKQSARVLESAIAFDWQAWNAEMDAHVAATQRAHDAWRKQALITHEAGRELVESFGRAIRSLSA